MPREKFIPNVESRSTRRSHRSDNQSTPSENSHHPATTISVENNPSQPHPTQNDSHSDEVTLEQPTQNNNTSNRTNGVAPIPSIQDTTRSRKRSTSSAKTTGQDVC